MKCISSAGRVRLMALFARELSAVINRVRGASGGIPMRAVAARPEIKAAEATIERAARLAISGRESTDFWRGALVVYESTWANALRERRDSDGWVPSRGEQ